MIKDPEVDAVAIATPVFTHYELAKKALEEGKSVFVEKPFTYTVAEAEELIELAEKKNLKIMVDHTFLYTGAVRKIKQLIEDNVLGDLYYFDSMRVNLGLFQHDVNVVWDLAPHDISIMDYLIGEKPQAVVATGAGHFDRELEDIAYLTFYYPRQHHRPHQRQLALPGEGQNDAHRRAKEDAGLERSGAGRKDQDLRQGRRGPDKRGEIQPACRLPLGGYVGAEDRTDRSPQV